jgi:hypothetical protein
MAGSTTTTTTIVPKPFKTTTVPGGDRAGAIAAAGDSTYRVTIDIPRIQANVLACEGGRLTELAVRTWLRSVGFTPEPGGDGATWLSDADSLRRLDKSEILRAERVHRFEGDVARGAN